MLLCSCAIIPDDAKIERKGPHYVLLREAFEGNRLAWMEAVMSHDFERADELLSNSDFNPSAVSHNLTRRNEHLRNEQGTGYRSLSTPFPEKWTPLAWATWAEDVEAVKYLLEAGADPNVITPDIKLTSIYHRTQYTLKSSPIHAAAHFRNTEILKLLVDNGGDINLSIDGQESAIFRASGNVSMLQFMLSLGATPDESRLLRWVAPSNSGSFYFILGLGWDFEAEDLTEAAARVMVSRALMYSFDEHEETAQREKLKVLKDLGADLNAALMSLRSFQRDWIRRLKLLDGLISPLSTQETGELESKP